MSTARTSSVLGCSGLMLVAALVYLNSLHNPFVHDDLLTVVHNESLRKPTLRGVLLQNVTRPLVNVSYVIDHTIWGHKPFGCHLTNVLLHMANVALLFLLVRGLALDRWSAKDRESVRRAMQAGTVAGLLFAVHPMMTGAVGYTSGRSDLLSGTLMLGSLLGLRQWLNTNRTVWLASVFTAWALALATKETAVVLPLLFLYYLFFVRRDPTADRRRHVRTVCLPLLAIATLGAVVRVGVFIFVEHAGVAQWQWRFLLTEVDVFVRYLAMMVAPIGQSIFHVVPVSRSLLDPRAVIALGITLTYLALIVVGARRRGVAAFGLLWFALTLLPSAMLILLNRGEAMSERRVYFAAAGLFLAAGHGAVAMAALGQAASRFTRVVVAAAAIVVLVGLAGRTVLRNYIWSNPVWLWAEAVDRNRGHWYPQYQLGRSLHEAGRHDDAILVLNDALRFGSQVTDVYESLGLCLVEQQRYDEAVVVFTALWTIHPESTAATNGRATLAMLRGHMEDARLGYLESLRHDPRNVQARRGLVTIEEEVGEKHEAERLCLEIASLAPGETDATCARLMPGVRLWTCSGIVPGRGRHVARFTSSQYKPRGSARNDPVSSPSHARHTAARSRSRYAGRGKHDDPREPGTSCSRPTTFPTPRYRIPRWIDRRYARSARVGSGGASSRVRRHCRQDCRTAQGRAGL
jgi:tetratricopeptide (TPR) repeat protein